MGQVNSAIEQPLFVSSFYTTGQGNNSPPAFIFFQALRNIPELFNAIIRSALRQVNSETGKVTSVLEPSVLRQQPLPDILKTFDPKAVNEIKVRAPLLSLIPLPLMR